MRKLVLFNMVSLDGFFEGPDRDIDWHNVDEEFNEFATEQLETVDTLLFGRVTYELMAGYWPTQAAIDSDPQIAEKMNSLPKIVFSKSLQEVDWQNTKLEKDAAKALKKLKSHSGKDAIIFGSGELASSLMEEGLIDEYRLMVNPVVLGQGTPMFNDLRNKLDLKLLRTRTFSSGNVLLYYQPDGNSSHEIDREKRKIELPAGLAQPAVRALAGAGIQNLEQLSRHREAEIKQLHGIGPNALEKLRRAIHERGLEFTKGKG